MSAALIALAGQIGAPVVRQILSRKFGNANGDLAADIIERIAKRAGGVTPEVLETMTRDQPQKVMDAILDVESESSELIALYTQGLEGQFALLQSEQKDPLWFRAWRPFGMVFIIFLWFWQIVALHLLNAVFKWALPPADWTALITFTSLYMSLYMGGHTVKDVMTKWSMRKGGGE